MYAIVRAGGRQEKVAVGDVITQDRVAGEPGEQVSLPAVLLVDGETVTSSAKDLGKVAVSAEIVGQLGQILGPRGLMPNPKVGTVTMDVTTAVKNAKAGQVQYRTDKGGIVHSTIGRASFGVEALEQNLRALVDALVKARPASAKGQYLKKIAVSSTMGPGVHVDQSTVQA